MSTDTLSDVLRAVRLTGAVFFSFEGSTPWVAEAPPAREIGAHLMPDVEHVIEYHVMKRRAVRGRVRAVSVIDATVPAARCDEGGAERDPVAPRERPWQGAVRQMSGNKKRK